MDALLIETEPYGDREIVDPSDDYWTGEIVATLELVRSWDHGVRTADELCQSIVAETMFYVLRPLFVLAGCGDVDYGIDPYAIVDELAPIGPGWCDDPDDSQVLAEMVDEAEGWAADVGMILETSGYCGMTWLYLAHDIDPAV